MIETLNRFRETLEDLGSGLGVTDTVAGPVVLLLKLPFDDDRYVNFTPTALILFDKFDRRIND